MLLKPSIKNTVARNQLSQSDYRQGHIREFSQGDRVMARDYRKDKKWESGTISARTGPVSYEVLTDHGQSWRRHTVAPGWLRR